MAAGQSVAAVSPRLINRNTQLKMKGSQTEVLPVRCSDWSSSCSRRVVHVPDRPSGEDRAPDVVHLQHVCQAAVRRSCPWSWSDARSHRPGPRKSSPLRPAPAATRTARNECESSQVHKHRRRSDARRTLLTPRDTSGCSVIHTRGFSHDVSSFKAARLWKVL